MSYTLDSSSPPFRGANKVLNKEVGELHTGQLNTCIQGANNALDKELGEIHTGQLLTLNKEVAELLTWPSLPHYEFSTKNTGFLPGGGPRGGRGATANQIKYIIISIHSFTISVRKKKYQNTFCDAIQVKPYDRNMIPRFTHFTILVKVPKHFL